MEEFSQITILNENSDFMMKLNHVDRHPAAIRPPIGRPRTAIGPPIGADQPPFPRQLASASLSR
jgi:hypothetical protein